jgi:hypothetical protein
MRQSTAAHVKRFIFASSMSVYGSSPTRRPVTEEDPPPSDEPYCASKLAVELIGQTVARQKGVEFVALRIAIVFILLFFCSQFAPAQTVPDAFFGMSVSQLSTSFPLGGGIVLGTLGKLDGASWKYIEPTQDCGPDPDTPCYHWGSTAPLNGLVGWATVAQANGYQLAYDFSGMPGWLCSQQNSSGECTALPSNLTAVSNFATALATKFNGQIKYYETYNEVNNPMNWSDTCPNLVLFHNTIYNAIKAADPNAIVGAPNVATTSIANSACASSPTPSGNPSDSSIWLRNFLATRDANGNLPRVDIVGAHMYGSFSYASCGNTSNPPCYVPLRYGCDWRVYKLHCAAQPLLNLYNAFRAVMNNNGLASEPLLVTEGGFGNDAPPPGWCTVSSPYANTACLSPAQQSAYVGRWLVLTASTWADGSGQLPSWYEYDGSWGTLNGTNGMNPQSASAYGQMENWLAEAVFQQPCHTGTPRTVFVCDFLNGLGQPAEIVFNDDRGAAVGYTPPAWATSYQPLLTSSAQAITGGSVAVGDTPILLSTAVVSSSPDFSMALSPTSQSVAPGQSATYTIRLSALGGFSGLVSLGCSVAPPSATCSVSTPAVIVTSAATSAATVVVTAPTASSAPTFSAPRKDRRIAWLLLLLGLYLPFIECRRRRRPGIVCAVALFVLCMGAGCGGGPSQQAQQATASYTVTITGTSGTIQNSMTATYLVQ